MGFVSCKLCSSLYVIQNKLCCRLDVIQNNVFYRACVMQKKFVIYVMCYAQQIVL